MKQLESEFNGRGEVKGSIFKRLLVGDKAYLYEVIDHETESIHYEVFKRKENTYYNCISYPTSKAFGVWAWSYRNFVKATEKFNQIRD